ncbi:MAG: alpha/beta hydrolase [Rickettsiales bacterium]|jgi:pimeloyl-ACP methyl ester carboxylesterase|nr:alpha/beta hydrolase [Rickettsiales bacterium]
MEPRLCSINIPDASPRGFHGLSYVEWGYATNSHVLVCVHGLTRNARDFDYIARVLSQHYRVICIDVPGRGKSDWLSDPMLYNYTTYVADTLYLLKTLGLERVHWLGTSMGGIIGMMIAATQPTLIERMILNDIGAVIPGKALTRIRKYANITPAFKTRAEAEAQLRIKLSPFGIREEEHWRHILTHSIIDQSDGTYIFAYDPAVSQAFFSLSEDGSIPDVEMWPIWEHVNCPTLIVRGEKSDTLLAETVLEMQARKPGTAAITFPNIGHAPALLEASQIEPLKEWLLAD